MPHKILSTQLPICSDKSLSKWERVIAEAKQKIVEFRRAIRTFESLRDQGMEFPEPEAKGWAAKARKGTSESANRLMGQK